MIRLRHLSWRTDDKHANGNIIGHGYIAEFDQNTAAITNQNKQMVSNGQRRLAIVVCYYQFASANGDRLSSDSVGGGFFVPQQRQNLIDLVKTASSLGIDEFMVEMDPQWSAGPGTWMDPKVMMMAGQEFGLRDWQPLLYANNFQFTMAVWQVFHDLGVQFRMDLHGEAVPSPAQPDYQRWLKYASRFWDNWCAMRGGDDGSVGFSIMPTPDRVPVRPQIFGTKLPPIWTRLRRRRAKRDRASSTHVPPGRVIARGRTENFTARQVARRSVATWMHAS